MIVWGGVDFTTYLNTGGRYNPDANTWTAISITNAPTPRSSHSAIWTGSEMIVWGGGSASGGRYDPTTDTWTSPSVPGGRDGHSAVWTGSEMIVWGGSEGTNNLDTGAK